MNISRLLIIIGIVLVILGLAWPLIQKLGLGRLPGDIVYEKTLVDPDLDGGQADPGCLVHGFGHVIDGCLKIFVNILHFPGRFLKKLIRIGQNS